MRTYTELIPGKSGIIGTALLPDLSTYGIDDIHGFGRAPNGVVSQLDVPGSIQTSIFAASRYGLLASVNIAGNFGNWLFRNGVWRQLDLSDVVPGQPLGSWSVYSLNNLGIVAGWASFEDTHVYASMIWNLETGALVRIPEFNDATPTTSAMADVNDLGVGVGYYADNNGIHGFFRQADGSMIHPFDPPGKPGSFPNNIANDGTIIGSCLVAPNQYMPYVRHLDGSWEFPSVPVEIMSLVQSGSGNGVLSTSAFLLSMSAATDSTNTRAFLVRDVTPVTGGQKSVLAVQKR